MCDVLGGEFFELDAKGVDDLDFANRVELDLRITICPDHFGMAFRCIHCAPLGCDRIVAPVGGERVVFHSHDMWWFREI